MCTPSGWHAATLSDVVAIQRGFDLPHHARRPGPYPVLTSGETGGWHDEGPVKGPGVTIGRATNLGQPKWSSTDFWPHNTTMFVRDFKGNEPRWVFHFFENTDLSGYDSGSVQPMLNRNYISQVPVLVPPRGEQRAIAEVLGALDDKIAANTRMCLTCNNLADVIYRQSASPERAVSLVELAKVGTLTLNDGYRTKKSEHGQWGLRILRAGDVRDGRVHPNGGDLVSASYLRQIGVKSSQPGDVLLTTKGTVGRVAVYPAGIEQTVYSPQICFFRTDRNGLAPPALLAAWLRSDEFHQQAQTVMFKSDMAPYISLADLRAMRISLPAAAQEVQVRARLTELQDVFEAAAAESNRLAKTRDALLPLLMSGKLRVKDAERVVEEAV